MKKFHTNPGPYIKSDNTTNKMMTNVLIALTPIILFAFYKNGVLPFQKGDTNLYGLFHPLIMMIVAALTSTVIEAIFILIKNKGKSVLSELIDSYAFFPGLFMSLVIPINTTIPVIILGALCASLIGKVIFGGFGKNVFNPALVGRFVIIAFFGVAIFNQGGYLNPSEIDAVTTATPLVNLNLVNGIGTYESIVNPFGSLWNFFFGMTPGTLGETSAFLILVALVFLSYKKAIKWIIPTTYILTVFFMTYLIGGYNGVGIWYPLFQVLSGGLLFGAVFMATDPVTSPSSKIGQILYGLFLGIITIFIRYLTSYPEGVAISILIMNVFVILLDKIGSTARINFTKAIIPFIVAWIMFIGLGAYISNDYKVNANKTDSDYTVLSKDIDKTTTTYVVKQKGYMSDIKAKIIIDNDSIKNIEIISQNESFYSQITKNDYINKIINNQNSLEELDTISGATVTSAALKKIVINTINDYKKGGGEIKPTEPEEKPKPDFNINSKETKGDITTYIVTNKGFSGNIKAEVIIDSGEIISLNILETKDHYMEKLNDINYIDTLIKNQNDLDNVDSVSGVTYTADYLKSMLKNVIADYNQ